MTLVAALLDGNIRYLAKHGLYQADRAVLIADGYRGADPLRLAKKILTYREYSSESLYQRVIASLLPGYTDMRRKRGSALDRFAEWFWAVDWAWAYDDIHEVPRGRVAIGGCTIDLNKRDPIMEDLAHHRTPYWTAVTRLRGQWGYNPGRIGNEKLTNPDHSFLLIYNDGDDRILIAGVGDVLERKNYLAVGSGTPYFKPQRRRSILHPDKLEPVHVYDKKEKEIDGSLVELIKLALNSMYLAWRKMYDTGASSGASHWVVNIGGPETLIAMERDRNLVLNTPYYSIDEAHEVRWPPGSAGWIPHHSSHFRSARNSHS